jgi:hypothetical protein
MKVSIVDKATVLSAIHNTKAVECAALARFMRFLDGAIFEQRHLASGPLRR